MAFLQELQERGWVESLSSAATPAAAAIEPSRTPGELVVLKIDLIFVVSGNPNAMAEVARPLPMVFVGLTDPVASGLVASLARPGGHVTGLSNTGIDLNPKRLELLKAAVPEATRVAILGNPRASPLLTDAKCRGRDRARARAEALLHRGARSGRVRRCVHGYDSRVRPPSKQLLSQ